MMGLGKDLIKNILSGYRITKAFNYLSPYKVVVLMYHDLSDDSDIPSWLRVKESAFNQQMKCFSRLMNILRPDQLFIVEALDRHKLNILITFDDGFTNQYRLGLPILQKYNVPALFFLSTEHVVSGETFWFDRIICPIQHKQMSSIDLRQLGLKIYRFHRTNGIERWNGIQVLLEDIKAKGNDTSPDVRRIINYFEDSFPDIMDQIAFKYRPLTKAEILEMKSTKLCYFGSHSHRHEILTYLKEDDIRTNLVKSKTFLEGLLGEPIAHFSYPNGNSNSRVIALCKETGYKYGYLASPGLLKRNTFPMSIPRITVSGYDTVKSILWKINREFVKSLGKVS
jgi:peptidoglycan/xylan/chitin deacetylase (PgdA/CDA1 family)